MSEEQPGADPLPPYLQSKPSPLPASVPEPAVSSPPAGDEPAAAAPAFQGAASGSRPTFRAPPRVSPQPQDDQPSSRVRSQPLPLSEPASVPYVSPVDATPSAPRWRWTWVVVAVAAIAWLVAIGLLNGGSGADRVSSPRLTLAAAWAFAALVTFLPIEIRRGLPGLTLQGVTGWTLLGYMLAYVPPPTGWLLELPDLPVYLLFFVALFYALSAAALPLTQELGQRLYSRRLHQNDLRRSRRQAYEIGLLAVAVMLLASLRVLMPLTILLLVAVFVLVETLLLSQVAPET